MSRPFRPDRSNPGLNPEACRSILVIVYQRSSVNQFHRAGGAHRCFRCATHCFSSGQYQQRAKPLTAVKHRVAHGLAQSDWGVGRNPVRQRVLHCCLLVLAPGVHIKKRMIGGVQSSVQV